MRKIILIAHTSLDGFVANTKGELDGFNAANENLAFVTSICKEGDASLFGRSSYQMINGFWPTAKDRPNASPEEIAFSHWYNSAQKMVISKTLEEAGLSNTILIKENIVATLESIKQLPGKSIILFGSPSIAQLLMRHNLLDIYWIFINPAIFGSGIPLFHEQDRSIQLTLTSTKQFTNGELALEYRR